MRFPSSGSKVWDGLGVLVSMQWELELEFRGAKEKLSATSSMERLPLHEGERCSVVAFQHSSASKQWTKKEITL